MFRKAVWKNTVSDTVSFHQDQALNTTIFLLKAYGPTGFLLKEEGELNKFKVFLGDPHTCTCPVFHREKEPCKHICWVLMRKFRLPREHEYCFQQGLVERQILEVLHGLHQTRTPRTVNSPRTASETPGQPGPGQGDGSVCRKVIQEQDVCPICQEELLEKQLPVSYCRFGCGNNVHISCMKVWADHQALSFSIWHGELKVRCPLCREGFSSFKLLQEQEKNAAKLYTASERETPNRHLGVMCHSCRVCPVTGTCFKCTTCSYYYLCEDCSQTGCHPQHHFASRTKRREKWHHVGDRLAGEPKGATATSQPVYDSIIPDAEDPLPEHVLRCLPAFRVRVWSELLDPGQQCRLCLHSFALGQSVRTLPCRHKFHTDCVDGILRKSNSCPLDGYVIYNPLTWHARERKTTLELPSCLSNDRAKLLEDNMKDLFIPGVSFLDKTAKATSSHSALSSDVRKDPMVPQSSPHKLMTNRLKGLCLETVDTVTKEGKGELQKDQTVFPKRSSYFDRLSKYDSGDRQSSHTHSSRERLAQHSGASLRRRAAATNVSEQAHEDLFVGSRRPPEPDPTATVAFGPWGTRLQPKPRAAVPRQDTSTRRAPELTMIGSLINTQCQRKNES